MLRALRIFRSWNFSKLNELGRKAQIKTMETNITDFSGTEQMDSDDFSIVVPAFPMIGVISPRNVRCSQDFGNSSPSRVTCRLTSDSIPLPGNKKAFGAVGWRSSFRYFVQNVRRKKKKHGRRRKRALVFPAMGALECLGSAMTGGSSGVGGGKRGAVRLFKGWLFALLVSWGLRSSVQQNSPSN